LALSLLRFWVFFGSISCEVLDFFGSISCKVLDFSFALSPVRHWTLSWLCLL
jgi:hypothetical protein